MTCPCCASDTPSLAPCPCGLGDECPVVRGVCPGCHDVIAWNAACPVCLDPVYEDDDPHYPHDRDCSWDCLPDDEGCDCECPATHPECCRHCHPTQIPGQLTLDEAT